VLVPESLESACQGPGCLVNQGGEQPEGHGTGSCVGLLDEPESPGGLHGPGPLFHADVYVFVCQRRQDHRAARHLVRGHFPAKNAPLGYGKAHVQRSAPSGMCQTKVIETGLDNGAGLGFTDAELMVQDMVEAGFEALLANRQHLIAELLVSASVASYRSFLLS